MSITSTPAARHTTALFLSACLAGTVTGATMTMTAPAAGSEQQSVKFLEATLRPSGDPDGSGHADFKLYPARGRICATVEWAKIQTPDSAHIHRRSDGNVVVDLSGSVTGGPRCATGVSRRLIGRILDHPRRYYFNVHNATYPAGAIQGRLHY